MLFSSGSEFGNDAILAILNCQYSGARAGGWGKILPRFTKPKKCCRKLVLFSRAVLNDKDPGRSDRKWVKNHFSTEIFIRT